MFSTTKTNRLMTGAKPCRLAFYAVRHFSIRGLGLLLLYLLAACAGDSSVTVGGSNVSATATRPYGGDLSGIEIRRIGNDAIRFRESQDRAIVNSLRYLEANGVTKDRIQQVTVETQGGERSGFGFVGSSPRYAVWVSVKGCESSLLFQASAGGSIATPRDRGGCLADKAGS